MSAIAGNPWTGFSKPTRKPKRVPKDWTGQRWGKLTAVRYVDMRSRGRGARWLFSCDCGLEKTLPVRIVRNGKRVSCGCNIQVAIPQPIEPAVVWPFPLRVGADGRPTSPVWRLATFIDSRSARTSCEETATPRPR